MRRKKIARGVLFGVFNMALILPLLFVTRNIFAADAIKDPSLAKWGFAAAAFAVGVGSLGAGLAVSSVGSAAVGAISENPKLLGKVLVFVGLAEGIAIYGLIIAIMILGRL